MHLDSRTYLMSHRFIVFMFVSLTEPDPHGVLEAAEGLCRITGQRTRGLGRGHAGTLNLFNNFN